MSATPQTAPAPLPPVAAPPRPRNQARRKPHDDASYFASGTGGGGGQKRHASDKVDGEPRVKRKRVDAGAVARRAERSAAAAAATAAAEAEARVSLVDFSTMPTAALHRYLMQNELIPPIIPSPLLATDPAPPSSLANPPPPPPSPPPPTTTPANRPRRDPRSRRGTREASRERTPVLADVKAVHGVLADIAQRHFGEQRCERELDVLSMFMCAVKARGGDRS